MKHEPASREPERPIVTGGMRARTIILMAAFLIFGFGILLYQLYALQLLGVGGFRARAAQQQVINEVLPATRGSIYTATGRLLARSTVTWHIIADPSEIDEAGYGYLRQASEELAALFNNGTTAESIYKNLTELNPKTNEPYKYRVLTRDLDMPTSQAVLDYARNLRLPRRDDDGNIVYDKETGLPEQGDRVLTLYREQSTVRSYPYGSFMSSVIGFCGNDGNGMYGLESSYNELLAGTPGRTISTRSKFGFELPSDDAETHPAIDGYDLHLTIDENVQSVLENYLARAIEDFDIHNRACGIVMNVNTGAILGMATLGQYDPNDPYTIADERMTAILDSEELSWDDIDRLESYLGKQQLGDTLDDARIDDDEYSKVQGWLREAQWKNKNLTELYTPGSVFKLFTASAALDSGLMNVNQTFSCNGSIVVNAGTQYRHEYNCANNRAHGVQDLAGALNRSCNLYFIQVGQLISPKNFFAYFDAFGFTEPTGIDLPYETRWMSYYNAEQMEQTVTNLYSAAFGQNMSVTPLQMATAASAVVNGGYLVTPYVVDSIVDSTGNIVQQTGTTIRRQVISEEVSASMREMMENVVGHADSDYHSGANAYVAGYRIGGKSGTAEQLSRPRRSDKKYYKTVSFTGVLPIDDPQILVLVVLDDPRWVEDSASQLAAPAVGNIISEIAPYLGIAKDPDYTPTGNVVVRSVIGETWNRAQVVCNTQGFAHQVIGPQGTVTYQYPTEWTRAPAGATIYLYTENTEVQKTVVPDVMGKTGAFAVQMLRAAGLNCQLEGTEEGRVVEQSLEHETSVELGTVVTITTDTAAPAETEGTAGS